MKINTVLGTIDDRDLGVTLPHEHIFLDLTNEFREPADPIKRRLSRQRITLANVGVLRRNPYALKANLLLDEFDVAVAEVKAFKRVGGRTVVDCTSIGIRQDIRRLARVARAAGVNVIAGCGYYTHDTHPRAMAAWTVAKIADDMVRELTEGIDGTRIRAGVIGEIGTSDPIHPNEMKCLRASAEAYRQTGVGIQVHIHPWGRTGPRVADTLIRRGVPPAKIVINHVDVVLRPAYLRALLDRGVFAQFDNFGKEFWIDPADRGYAGGVFAPDVDRVKMIRRIVDWGFERQVLITNDICLKCMLHRYGGWGYDHVIRNVPPMLEEAGVSRATVNRFLVDNPRRFMIPDRR